MKPSLMGAVLESFERLKARADLVLVEGAGSPAEVNLRKADIANMGFARKADVPVVLVGDIDRGGVIAQLVGIKTVIDPDDAAMIQGFVINKFRGDPTLFDDGYRLIETKTAWRGFGVLPWFRARRRAAGRGCAGPQPMRASRANARSPASRCRGSPISTISIR
ncbi:MAG: AAA family ATPase [Aquabacterium sp.]